MLCQFHTFRLTVLHLRPGRCLQLNMSLQELDQTRQKNSKKQLSELCDECDVLSRKLLLL